MPAQRTGGRYKINCRHSGRFCRGLSVPRPSGRRGHFFLPESPLRLHRAKLTPRYPRHKLPPYIEQAWEAGKAVKIGHGPATVIGETP